LPGDSSRVLISELSDTPIAPAGTTYYLINATLAGVKLGKNLSILYGLMCGGTLDLYGFNASQVRGFYFNPTIKNTTSTPVTVTTFDAMLLNPIITGTGPMTITSRNYIRVQGGSPVPSQTSIQYQRGLYIQDLQTSPGATNVALDIENQTQGTIRKLLRAKGTTQSNLEIDADDPPDLMSPTEAESAILISFTEDSVPTVRKVRWKQQDQLVATDKVLVAA